FDGVFGRALRRRLADGTRVAVAARRGDRVDDHSGRDWAHAAFPDFEFPCGHAGGRHCGGGGTLRDQLRTPQIYGHAVSAGDVSGGGRGRAGFLDGMADWKFVNSKSETRNSKNEIEKRTRGAISRSLSPLREPRGFEFRFSSLVGFGQELDQVVEEALAFVERVDHDALVATVKANVVAVNENSLNAVRGNAGHAETLAVRGAHYHLGN